jgi:transcriptional regulator with GAF, ATPase, and Fis domain
MEFKDPDGGADQQTRYEALRQVSGVIASQADLNGVLENLARFLPLVVNFEFLGVVLHDAKRQVFRLHAFESRLPAISEAEIEIPEAGSSATVILEEQKPIILNDIEKETRFADIVERARPYGVRSLCLLPLTRLSQLGAIFI